MSGISHNTWGTLHVLMAPSLTHCFTFGLDITESWIWDKVPLVLSSSPVTSILFAPRKLLTLRT